MAMPLDLPSSVQLSKINIHADILPVISPETQLDDMKYARTFKDEYLKTHKQVNWKMCYGKGLKEGYFARYKNCKTLKNTFNEVGKWLNIVSIYPFIHYSRQLSFFRYFSLSP
ncbi:unnamed protein product [Rhizopus stolonifer]